MCRSEGSLSPEIRKKIALFASLPIEAIVSACDVDNIYKVPLSSASRAWTISSSITSAPDAPTRKLSSSGRSRSSAPSGHRARCGSPSWASTCSSRTPTCRCPRRCATPGPCRTAPCRSTGSTPSAGAGADAGSRRARRARALEPAPTASSSRAASADAGSRARSPPHGWRASGGSPILGICLGMHVAVAEFARHVAGMDGANSTEMDMETPYPVIDLLPEQKEVADLGGTMRLGADPIKLHDGSRRGRSTARRSSMSAIATAIEVNNLLRKRPGGGRAARVRHLARRAPGRGDRARATPFFVASQFHPEFKSRPERPAPLFRDFVAAALERAAQRFRRITRTTGSARRRWRRVRPASPPAASPVVSRASAGATPTARRRFRPVGSRSPPASRRD